MTATDDAGEWQPIPGLVAPERDRAPQTGAAAIDPSPALSLGTIGPRRPLTGPDRSVRHRLQPPPVPTGPLVFTDVLDGSFKLYRASGKTILTVALAALIPLQLALSWFQRESVVAPGGGWLSDPEATLAAFGEPAGVRSLLVGLLVVQGLVLPLLRTAWTGLAARRRDGRSGTTGDAVAVIRHRGVAAIGGTWLRLVCYGLAVAPGLLVVAAGGSPVGAGLLLFLGAVALVVVMPLLVMLIPAVVVEGLGPLRALRRSARLARRRYIAVAGTTYGTSFVIGLLSLLVSGGPEAAGAALPGYGWVLLAVGAVISELISGPLTAHVALLIFDGTRARLEGHDLVLRARARRTTA